MRSTNANCFLPILINGSRFVVPPQYFIWPLFLLPWSKLAMHNACNVNISTYQPILEESPGWALYLIQTAFASGWHFRVFAHVGSANTWSGVDFEILVWMKVRESKSEMFKLNDLVQRYSQSVTILRKSRQSYSQSVTILRKSRQSFCPPRYNF